MKSFLNLRITIELLFYTISVSGKWPDDLQTQFDFPTPSPLELNSSQATAVTGLSPLHFVFPEKPVVDKFNVTNNGVTIIANLAQPSTNATVTGSIFKDEVYELRQVSLALSNNYRDNCGTIVDGRGTPIEMANVYIKRNYSTIEEAKTKRDGMAIVVKRIIVNGVLSNYYFPNFAKILEKVETPNSSVIATAAEFFRWYDRLPNYYHNYFMHPGSYVDPNSGYGTRYQCAIIVIMAPSAYPSISFSEFGSFLKLRSADGSPMSNSLPSFQMGPVPLIEGSGIKVELFYG